MSVATATLLPPAPRRRHWWTAADDLDLSVSYARGDAVADIARRLGVTDRAVMGRARNKGYRHREKDRTVEERFWAFVRPSETNDCLLWTGAVTSGGRGNLSVAGVVKLATHIALQLRGIAVPPGSGALHRCDNPLCVNADHLFVGTQLENVRDCRAKGRLPQMVVDRRGIAIPDDECLNGHTLTGRNLYISPAGMKMCRRCRANNAAALRLRLRTLL